MSPPRDRHNIVPVIGIAAMSGTGKTTLLLQVVPLLRDHGLRIGFVKRAHHTFDTDKPGKDSYELRKAGAAQVLVGSSRRWALMVERETPTDPELPELLSKMPSDSLDLIIVEGFKAAPIPKIEVHRPSLGHPLLAMTDPYVIAVATDDRAGLEHVDVPLLDMNQPREVADFMRTRLAIGPCDVPGLRLPATVQARRIVAGAADS